MIIETVHLLDLAVHTIDGRIF